MKKVTVMSDIRRVQNAAYAVTGITRAQIDADLFVVDGKVKNRTGEALAIRWQSSGEKDYGIYEGEDYLRELLYCWNCYSGPSAVRLITHMLDVGITMSSSHDHQGGIGMTTALLARAFPEARHTITVGGDEHGEHGALARTLFSSLDLQNAAVTSGGCGVDLLVAQETFEHFPNPIDHLIRVLDECKPHLYFDASSFELTGSPGHFAHNKHIRPAFSSVLAESGYVVAWRDEKFDEGFDEKKAPETLPTLWRKTGA